MNLKILIHLKSKYALNQVDKLSIILLMKDLEISKIADQENYIISFQISKSLNLMKMSFEIWGEIRSGPLGGTPQNNISRAELRAM